MEDACEEGEGAELLNTLRYSFPLYTDFGRFFGPFGPRMVRYPRIIIYYIILYFFGMISALLCYCNTQVCFAKPSVEW